MRVEPQFVSVGVNRIVNALDWGDNGLIAYAGHHIVCVYDPEVSNNMLNTQKLSAHMHWERLRRSRSKLVMLLLLLLLVMTADCRSAGDAHRPQRPGELCQVASSIR
jgi:hypothetical protein